MGDEKKNRKRCFVVAALSLSFVIVVVLGEILVRMFFPYMTPDTLRKSSLQYLPSIFSKPRLIPMQQVVEREPRFQFFLSKKENDEPQVKYIINNIGYRGDNVDLLKPNDVIRIIIVGGSAVFDLNAVDNNTARNKDWPHLVENILNGQGRQQYEVINAGTPGHTSFDSLGRLYSQLWVYRPDYVVLYNGWNDIKYFRKLKPETPLITLYVPNYQKNSYTNYLGKWDWWFSHSQLYNKLRNRYLTYTFDINPGGKTRWKEGIIEEGTTYNQYSPYAIAQFKLNVEMFVDASRNIGAIPILLTQATLVAPYNSQEEKNLIKYPYVKLTHETLVKAFEDTYRVIRETGQGKGVATLDLAEKLNGRVELFVDHVHTTAKGSEEIAAAVAEFLLEQLKVRSPT